MIRSSRGPPESGLWAYAYDITLPESEELRSIRELLEREHLEARASARTWAAQLVVLEPQITRILVVSDSPEQDRAINRNLEAALAALPATFTVTEPMAVSNDD